MKVLYVSHGGAFGPQEVLGDLIWLEPALDIHTAAGAAEALAEIRRVGGYSALFLSPALPQNESLALIASLRRDRIPIAIVGIVTEAERHFFALAVTAGADDVLVLREGRLLAVEDTLRRVRNSRHRSPDNGHPRLQVLYAGQDDQAWSILKETPFAYTERTTAAADGVCSLVMTEGEQAGDRCDVLVIDDNPGDAHALQVVKWVKSEVADLPVVVMTPATAGDIAGAALELGADEVVSKAGSYKRRLAATLHRLLLRDLAREMTVRAPAASGPVIIAATSPLEEFLAEPIPVAPTAEPPSLPSPPPESASDEERERMAAALREAEDRISALSQEAAGKADALESLRREHERAVETQAFERALRERDREELASFRRALQDERERRIVLEGTLRHTEDRASDERKALEDAHAATRKRLEDQLAAAADRLHTVASETQALQQRLEQQLAANAAERDRLFETSLSGRAVLSDSGELIRCNDRFARIFGFQDADDARQAVRGGPFAGLPDHGAIVEQLRDGATLDVVESTARRRDGRPFRILTTAVLHVGPDEPAEIERQVVDLSQVGRLEAELRLARRLESAGRLAAQMSPEIEPLLPALAAGDASADDRARATSLVRQLLAYSRTQARPAGFLSLNEAIARAESLLRRVAGDRLEFSIRLGEVAPVTAGEDDVEQLLAELVFAGAAALPYGGSLTLETAPATIPTFVLSTAISVTATGYGVLPLVLSSSLERLVNRCGGSVRTSGEAGRTGSLHVLLPC